LTPAGKLHASNQILAALSVPDKLLALADEVIE
jgi:hypothetical protein